MELVRDVFGSARDGGREVVVNQNLCAIRLKRWAIGQALDGFFTEVALQTATWPKCRACKGAKWFFCDQPGCPDELHYCPGCHGTGRQPVGEL